MQADSSPTLTRAETIRQFLADDIVRGRLPPGVALDENDIARKFGVSRTPVREAIRQLEATGLVEARPRRGAVVAIVTKERLDEMFFMMIELEALCAREAAMGMTQSERAGLKRLQASGDAVAMAGEVAAYSEHNLALHNAIYSGAHNAYLTEMTLAVRSRLAPFRRAQFDGAGRVASSHREHEIVVAAIIARDGAGASDAMRSHIRVVRDTYVTLAPHYAVAAPEW